MLGYLQVGDLGYASELGNYAEYSGAPNEEEVLQYARIVIDVSIKYSVNLIYRIYHHSFNDGCHIYLCILYFKNLVLMSRGRYQWI